ncbi:MAG TPA: diaminopimelate epimerase [Acidobacteriaceae bacterium]|nr:diaminopimelate epimerase [Acidobacteriaceae bacterium]
MLRFVKAHACGNDFLVIEEEAAAGRHVELAKRLCARHTGVGADGIEFLERRQDGSLFLRLFNADGGEAELSGNGTRCVAAWLAASEDRTEMTFGTRGGPRTCTVLDYEDPTWWIESGMGVPRVMPRTIEIEGVSGPMEGAMVNVGNPHFVLFPKREDFGSDFGRGGMSWEELGAKISVDPMFEFGTNVEFVRVLSDGEIAFRIYERGCGPTQSSGTGTCASAAAAMVLKGVHRELAAASVGGTQRVVWPENDQEMRLTGPAEIICTGEVEFA